MLWLERSVQRSLLGLVVGLVVVLGVGACGDSGDAPSPSMMVIPPSPTMAARPAATPPPVIVPTRASTCIAPKRPQPSVVFETAFPGLTVSLPTQLVQDRSHPSRWYVTQQTGEIIGFDTLNPAGAETVFTLPPTGTPGVDLNGGLVGIALHPNFATNGRAFLHLSQLVGPKIQVVIARITTNDAGHTFGDYTELIGPYDEPAGMDHHGGGIAFGPDGMLYLSMGDGGCCDDPVFNGQSKQGLHAKVLRIDVDSTPLAGSTYVIPPDNPFVGTDVEPATFARGFRNPWRLSFDRDTGDLWLGDVGENSYEEIDRVIAGGNYGWPCREGAHDNLTSPDHCPDAKGLTDPYFDYAHTGATAITGGVVYRGHALPDLIGSYIYGDNVTQVVRAIPANAPPIARVPVVLNGSGPEGIWVNFAEDIDGEVYAVDLVGNAIYAIVPGKPSPSFVPKHLSETGCVEPKDPRTAKDSVAYDVASPLWSDGATKERHFAIPDGTKITVNGTHLDLPIGSVAMKTFLVGGTRIETRLLVRHDDGEWAGYSYRWTDDESDATLLADTDTRVLTGQTWTFPSRSQCLECHTRAAGRSLGLDTRQLDANALGELVKRGWLSALPSGVKRFPTPSDDSMLVPDRARSYLHANCAQCHRPGGGPTTEFDLRFETPLASTHLCNESPTEGDLGVPGAKILVAGAPDHSLISLRAHRSDTLRMPRLGVSIPDADGLAVVDAWIDSLATCP